MTTILELVPDVEPAAATRPMAIERARREALLPTWLKAQAVNVTRHAAGLRPFARDEFGAGSAAPTEGHLKAANDLIRRLRDGLLQLASRVSESANDAARDPSTQKLTELLRVKDAAHNWVQGVEKVWDFYFELFGQRQTRFADWLLSCDRIALDCYQYSYLGIGNVKSIPAPPPFSYMKTGFSPATFRRSIPLRSLGLQLNPFPLIQLPYHRLMNPWTLGAVLHEVSHNLQNDLGLDKAVPAAIAQRLTAAQLPRPVIATWVRWNRETFADMAGLLFGGPAIVSSLMDVVGRSRENTLTFTEGASHPTPFLRTLLSCELLRRMGFDDDAKTIRAMWKQLYPKPSAQAIPRAMLATFDQACALVVDTICYQRYATLGNKTLAEVIRFEKKEQAMIEEAARRLATGTDPGVVPERFLIAAARIAFDRKLARPGVITDHFYRELARR
ncbi:MAG TPA: hypothetical protein VF608_09855 [Thermoanaerobaculia bacterium]